jgi:hypothetical protein
MSLFGHFAQKKAWRSALKPMGARESHHFVEGMTFATPAKSTVVIDVMNRIDTFDENSARYTGTSGAERCGTT